ncbi:unnamed protein product [Albugo candida]|uniref:WRKY19-like zinc finger domain-containing protein n=1 Tax=Albugo candida TaxID=65357 RepID=A0A024G6G2_9STRA|nr:unnamed protein product [Albugo candida]|eukprot:CCI42342.1 unnamed protein product [Albugo candida]
MSGLQSAPDVNTEQRRRAPFDTANHSLYNNVSYDISSWNTSDSLSSSLKTCAADTSPKTFGALLASSNASGNSHAQHYFQLPSVSGFNGQGSTTPVLLSRHTSLPNRSPTRDYQADNSSLSYNSAYYNSTYLSASNLLKTRLNTTFGVTPLANVPTLNRHQSVQLGSITPTSFPPLSRSPIPYGNNLEISTGNQSTHSVQLPPTLFGSRSKSINDLEPIHFEQRKAQHDSFEFEPLSFSLRRDLADSHEGNISNCNPEFAKSGSCELGQMERAFESLDRLIPEMDQELFQPSELNSIAISGNSLNQSASGQHLISRGGVEFFARGMMHDSGKKINTTSSKMTPSHKGAMKCSIAGCERRVRSRGFCKSHGGGRKCTIDGCNKSSQNGDLCIGHGGGKKCKHEGCSKASQSHGLCKAHGGGARCKFPDCSKSSQGGGLCRAHGGGKRCHAVGCQKGAQRGNFCATHGGFLSCKIEGCVRTDRGGGLCEIHRRGKLCKVPSCKKLARNREMCTMHIRAERQQGR